MAQPRLVRETCDFSGNSHKVDLFDLKTKLCASLPGKYRNGVVVAFCNLGVFPWLVENS